MQIDRIVIVGCGSIGLRHARVLAARNDVAVELCEPNAERLTAACRKIGGLVAHNDFDAMLATRPAMIVVATPHSLHARQAVTALRAGVHVLCEKPMSDNLSDAERMLLVAEQSGCLLEIGFTLRFHPAMLRIKNLIDAGELGRIVHIHWHVGAFNTLANSVSRHQATQFGSLMMDYSHQSDLIGWWLQMTPSSVYALGCTCERLPLAVNPNAMAVAIEYGGRALATINLNYVQHPQQCICEIIGDQAWLTFDLETAMMRIGRRNESTVTEEMFSIERDQLFRAEHDAFIKAARGTGPAESPPDGAIRSMRIVDAAIRSMQTRVPVTLQAG